MSLADTRAAFDALGGLRASAAKLGCGIASVVRYASGERRLPEATAAVLREMVTSEGLRGAG
jgi:hypothetical protein